MKKILLLLILVSTCIACPKDDPKPNPGGPNETNVGEATPTQPMEVE